MKQILPSIDAKEKTEKNIAPVISMEEYLKEKEGSLSLTPFVRSEEENNEIIYSKPIFTVKKNDPL